MSRVPTVGHFFWTISQISTSLFDASRLVMSSADMIWGGGGVVIVAWATRLQRSEHIVSDKLSSCILSIQYIIIYLSPHNYERISRCSNIALMLVRQVWEK